MDDFFAPPPPPQRPEPQPRYRGPEWMGPPDGTLPGVAELELVLARTELVAVCLSGVRAYPTGVLFDLITMGGPGSEALELDPQGFMHRIHRRGRGAAGLPDDLLRFGVELADGRRVTNVRSHPLVDMADAVDGDDESFTPPGPVLIDHGGGGGGGADWTLGMWLWPLPEPGTIVLACEWPAAGIPVTRTEVDAGPLLTAAARAQVVFDFPEPPEQGAGGRFAA